MGHSSQKNKSSQTPSLKVTRHLQNPDHFSAESPSWKFHLCDKEMWQFSKENVGDIFWDKILSTLQGWETQTWQQILIDNERLNHRIEVTKLNKIARDRFYKAILTDDDHIVSLHLQGTYRLYGILQGSSFCIIWFDKNHGDNDTCVCRSYKKHT